MTKPEWGVKRKCLKCENVFYDMRKKEFACPKCGTGYTVESYEEMKAKQIAKMAKKSAAKIDDEELDEEALLKMTADVPLGEEVVDAEEIDLLEDAEDSEHPGIAKKDYMDSDEQ